MENKDGKSKIEYCADTIPLYRNQIALIRRLTYPCGLALPGGRRDVVAGKLEGSVECAVRELREETGLSVGSIEFFSRYDAPGRDPRGPKVSDVFFANVYGKPRDEKGKTNVEFYALNALPQKDDFAFDHYDILNDFIRQNYGVEKNE